MTFKQQQKLLLRLTLLPIFLKTFLDGKTVGKQAEMTGNSNQKLSPVHVGFRYMKTRKKCKRERGLQLNLDRTSGNFSIRDYEQKTEKIKEIKIYTSTWDY